jgi:hypothetical protein
MNKVTIISSPELSEMKLEDLAGRQGEIAEPVYDKTTGVIRGAWIKLNGESYLQEQEWFIPITSLGK